MENQFVYDKALAALRKEHTVFEEREKFLEEEHEVTFHTVKFRHIPEWLPYGIARQMRLFVEFEPEEFTCPSCDTKLTIENDVLKQEGVVEEAEEAEDDVKKKRKERKLKKKGRAA